jgi:hypothetical protein
LNLSNVSRTTIDPTKQGLEHPANPSLARSSPHPAPKSTSPRPSRAPVLKKSPSLHPHAFPIALITSLFFCFLTFPPFSLPKRLSEPSKSSPRQLVRTGPFLSGSGESSFLPFSSHFVTVAYSMLMMLFAGFCCRVNAV